MLESFAGGYGITYDLLSDEGSVVIERLGLLNEHIEAQQAFFGSGFEQRHRRLPHPGTLVLDQAGTVVERLFEQGFRSRPSPGATLRRVSGVPPAAARSVTGGDDAVAVTAFVDSTSFRPMQTIEVHVELRIAEGWHIYTEPVPDGFRALYAAISADAEIRTWPVAAPAGRPFVVEGLPGRFFVLDGSVLLSVPVLLPGSGYLPDGQVRPVPAAATSVTLEVEVGYQACSDTECLPPVSLRLPLTLEEQALLRPP